MLTQSCIVNHLLSYCILQPFFALPPQRQKDEYCILGMERYISVKIIFCLIKLSWEMDTTKYLQTWSSFLSGDEAGRALDNFCDTATILQGCNLPRFFNIFTLLLSCRTLDVKWAPPALSDSQVVGVCCRQSKERLGGQMFGRLIYILWHMWTNCLALLFCVIYHKIFLLL